MFMIGMPFLAIVLDVRRVSADEATDMAVPPINLRLTTIKCKWRV